MKPTAPLRAGLIAVLALGLTAATASCSSDHGQPGPPSRQPTSHSPSSPAATTPTYDDSFAFVVADQGLVSMPLPSDAVAAPGDHVDLSLTNQSHSAYRLQLFDAGRKLVQQMSAAAGKQINMAVVMGSPGLYTVEFRPEGHGKPLYAAVKVKK